MSAVLAAFITAISAIVVAGTTYWFAKQRELDAELRKEKLDHYKAFALSLSSIIEGESTPDGQIAFARACNNLNLVAPQAVIEKLRAFQEEIKVSNPSPDRQHHDRRMSELFFTMRRDLRISPKDDAATFAVGLWTAGQPRQ